MDGGACFAAAHFACPASPLAEASGDYDSVTYRQRTGDLTLNLANGAASQGESGEGDIVRNVEHADTGEGDDFVTGNAAANIINTYGGNDFAFGREGNDVLDGAEGDDWLGGGEELPLDHPASPSQGSDEVLGGPGSDVVYDGDLTSKTRARPVGRRRLRPSGPRFLSREPVAGEPG